MQLSIAKIDREKVVFASISLVCLSAGLVTGMLSLVAKPIYLALLITACLAPAIPLYPTNGLNRAAFLVGAVATCVAVALFNIALLPIAAALILLLIATLSKRKPQAP